MPEELLAAKVCERFHLSADEYERYQARYELWYAMLVHAEQAPIIRDKLLKPGSGTMTADDQKWLEEWFEFVPSGMLQGPT